MCVWQMVVLKDKLAASVAINDTYIAQIAKLESEVRVASSLVDSMNNDTAPCARLSLRRSCVF